MAIKGSLVSGKTTKAKTAGIDLNQAVNTVNNKIAAQNPAVKQPYLNEYNQYEAKQNDIRNAYLQSISNDYAAQKEQANNQYNQAARQNYINYRQNQRNLPGQLNSLGIRGGASESAAVRMNNAYGNNVASNDAARANALTALAQNEINARAQYNRDVDSNLAAAYVSAMENQIKYDEEQKAIQRELEQQAYERQRDAEATAWEKKKYKQESQKEAERYDTEQDRYRTEKRIEQFAAGLTQYVGNSGIETLQKMINDITKQKGWSKDTYKFGKVQAMRARIGAIREAKEKNK